MGELELHVESSKALLICRYLLADTLITHERPETLGALILCAAAVATELQDRLGVGNGWLEWQLESDRVADIRRLFPSFKTMHRLHRRKRGTRCLRFEP